ncbi:MAG: hypothetical protein EAZ40_04520 [Rhodobacterales bacterium]|nr:MAG: hypothetical protein EAZ40_04520 [Rhodobacterales bacterium]
MTPRSALCAAVAALIAPVANATTWDCKVLQASEAANCDPLGYEYSFQFDVADKKAVASDSSGSSEWLAIKRTQSLQMFAQPDGMDAAYLALQRDGTLMMSSLLVDDGHQYILMNLGVCQERG